MSHLGDGYKMNRKKKKFQEELLKFITTSDKIFIIGHNNLDYDAIGAALGIATLAKHYRKQAYIIVNDPQETMDPGVKKVIDDTKDYFNYITLKEYRDSAKDQDALVIVDTNKPYLLATQYDLGPVGKTFVIDHHETDEFSLKTTPQYIDERASSTCEIISQLLIAKQIKEISTVADYLLAGIILDTKRFQKNTTPTTFDTAEKLWKKGANYDAVNRLFISNFEEERTIYQLLFGEEMKETSEDGIELVVRNTIIQAYPKLLGEPTVSFTLNRKAPGTVYRQVDLAKAADKMLKYADACFVIGKVSDDRVGISARSKCNIDVGEILSGVQNATFPREEGEPIVQSGGGNKQSAGGNITTNDIFAVEKFLTDSVLQYATPEEEKEEKPVVLVRKQRKVSV